MMLFGTMAINFCDNSTFHCSVRTMIVDYLEVLIGFEVIGWVNLSEWWLVVWNWVMIGASCWGVICFNGAICWGVK